MCVLWISGSYAFARSLYNGSGQQSRFGVLGISALQVGGSNDEHKTRRDNRKRVGLAGITIFIQLATFDCHAIHNTLFYLNYCYIRVQRTCVDKILGWSWWREY